MKTNRLIILAFVLFMAIACTANLGNIPWYEDIKTWSPHQKADFFMNIWLAEKESYDRMNAITNKPDSLIKSLQAKYRVLEDSRIPIRTYSTMVKSGAFPTGETTQEIINFIEQLQINYVYGGE